MDPSQSLALRLPGEADTLALGRALARILADPAKRAALLLRGDLGSGKTTLVRGLVEALPGGDDAEVASPSFNIVNVYPTRPEVFHVDLYRIPGGDPSVEEHLEAAAAGDALVVVEWGQYLPRDLLPANRLECDWLPAATGRLCRMTAFGMQGQAALAALAAACPGLVGGQASGTTDPPDHLEATMRIMVQKYGGTSVKGLERMRLVLGRVQKARADGFKVVVALSAMSGETNRLLDLAREFSPNPDPAELDVLVTTGEQVSVALFAMLCKDAGLRARSLLGFQIPITTNSNFCRARIMEIDTERLRGLLEDYDVLVVAGFQGVDCLGRLTTLGRGGSDTTGVALAAALDAEVCEIYTDVNGVYTTDPNLCGTARKLERISYDEMLEFSSMGAKVLQIRSVEFAKKFNVPVRVRSTFTDDPGTLVTLEDTEMEDVLVSGIAYDKDQCRITVRNVIDRPGVAAAIFAPIAEAGILVDMIIQNTGREGRTDMTFTISRANLDKTLAILEKLQPEIGAAEIQHDTNVCKVSVIGVGMRSHSGVASMMFTILKKENINILMIATSEIKITCLIEEKYLELAVRTLHDAFGLSQAPTKAC